MEVLRYAAFTTTPDGGNPAGVVLDATGLSDPDQLAIAAEVGYAETAFLVSREDGEQDIRYFSPLAEVRFCGHATIAAAVAHADLHGPSRLVLHTRAGTVTVTSARDAHGQVSATLTSVPPASRLIAAADVDSLLDALRWTTEDLDPTLPIRAAYAGAWHPVVAAATRGRLADLNYDFEALGAVMAAQDWTTVQLIWRESPTVFHVRNPFPPGGLVEDPATGAAAAAFGGYLRELELVEVPTTLTIHQGHDLGRPSLLRVAVAAEAGTGIEVTGTAVPIPWPS